MAQSHWLTRDQEDVKQVSGLNEIEMGGMRRSDVDAVFHSVLVLQWLKDNKYL
jgi:hypothetical protein